MVFEGPWFGDPHIITSDGLPYTFNGLGEYLFTKVGDGDTIIQARTERVEISNGGNFGCALHCVTETAKCQNSGSVINQAFIGEHS